MLVLVLWSSLPLNSQPSSSNSQASPALVIDDCRYRDDAAARAAWQPMGGSASVSVALMDGRQVLRLPCNFAGTKIERASWDRPVKLDLSAGRGVRFELFCRAPAPVSYFSLYFQSGDGWYHASFYPETSTGWNSIAIDKTEMRTEGKPAGWGQISAIRLSAWRAKDADTEFYLRDFCQTGVLGVDASVVILRADAAARRQPGEARNLEQYAGTVAQYLRGWEVGCVVLSDSDLTPGQLRRASLVILPYNPDLPELAAEELLRYLREGGKLLLFYTVPEPLRPALKLGGGQHVKAPRPGFFSAMQCLNGALPGAPPSTGQQSWNINAFQPLPGDSRMLAEWLDDKGHPTGYPAVLASSNCIVMTHVLLPDDSDHKRRLLLAMAGFLAPDVWRQAAQAGIARMGKLGGFTSYDEAASRIARLGRQEARVTSDTRATNVTGALASAQALRDSALKEISQARFAKALDDAAAADHQIQRAFCLAQSPLPGEFRAFWCHSAFGVQGIDWDEAIRRLADNGFTAILPNLLWGGAAFYPSKVLPVAPGVAERGDQLAQCLAACRKHGLQIHVWKVNWNLGSSAPKEFVAQLRQARRLQAGSRGEEQLWLCPSHPENQRLEAESLLEIVRQYDVDGIHFDYIRYPDADHCFCPGCQERFQAAVGLKVQNWPKDLLAEGELRRQWLDWRRGNITAVVKAVSEKARLLKPKIKLSAAVFPNWVSDRDNVGQDWKLWCDRGYLDFVCPMDYTSSNNQFENLAAQQVQWAGRTPCYPGIGVSASSSHFGVDRVIDQINLSRKHHTGGFIIFNYGVSESQELLPLLGLGITAKGH